MSSVSQSYEGMYRNLLNWNVDALYKGCRKLSKRDLASLASEINTVLVRFWGEQEIVHQFLREMFDSNKKYRSFRVKKSGLPRVNRKRALAFSPGSGYHLLNLEDLQKVVLLQLVVLNETKKQKESEEAENTFIPNQNTQGLRGKRASTTDYEALNIFTPFQDPQVSYGQQMSTTHDFESGNTFTPIQNSGD